MGIALFSAAALMESLHGVMGWLAPGGQRLTARAAQTAPEVWRRRAASAARGRNSQGSHANHGAHGSSLALHATAHAPSASLPCATRQVARVARVPRMQPVPSVQLVRALRVVRLLDSASSACAGRMVISGRMADVCAELDRLAALEAGGPSAIALN